MQARDESESEVVDDLSDKPDPWSRFCCEHPGGRHNTVLGRAEFSRLYLVPVWRNIFRWLAPECTTESATTDVGDTGRALAKALRIISKEIRRPGGDEVEPLRVAAAYNLASLTDSHPDIIGPILQALDPSSRITGLVVEVIGPAVFLPLLQGGYHCSEQMLLSPFVVHALGRALDMLPVHMLSKNKGAVAVMDTLQRMCYVCVDRRSGCIPAPVRCAAASALGGARREESLRVLLRTTLQRGTEDYLLMHDIKATACHSILRLMACKSMFASSKLKAEVRTSMARLATQLETTHEAMARYTTAYARQIVHRIDASVSGTSSPGAPVPFVHKCAFGDGWHCAAGKMLGRLGGRTSKKVRKRIATAEKRLQAASRAEADAHAVSHAAKLSKNDCKKAAELEKNKVGAFEQAESDTTAILTGETSATSEMCEGDDILKSGGATAGPDLSKRQKRKMRKKARAAAAKLEHNAAHMGHGAKSNTYDESPSLTAADVDNMTSCVCAIGYGNKTMERDAIDVANALSARGYSAKGTVLTGSAASKSAVELALKLVLKQVKTGPVVIFISCHGEYEADGVCGLSMHGGSVSVKELRQWCLSTSANVMLVVDACFSGALLHHHDPVRELRAFMVEC